MRGQGADRPGWGAARALIRGTCLLIGALGQPLDPIAGQSWARGSPLCSPRGDSARGAFASSSGKRGASGVPDVRTAGRNGVASVRGGVEAGAGFHVIGAAEGRSRQAAFGFAMEWQLVSRGRAGASPWT